MLQNLENLVGNDAIIRIQMVNEKYERSLPNVVFKNLIYFINNPIKIILILSVISFKLPEYIITCIMLFEWLSKLLEYSYYKNLNEIMGDEGIFSKRNRIISCTDYDLLINIFERPMLENINKINYCLFIIIVIISGRPFQAAMLTLFWQFIVKMKKVTKELLIDYLENLIKEDWKIGTT